MKIKKLLLLLTVLMIILPTSISAESSSKKEEDKNISETLVPKDYSKMEDGRKAVYYLDVSAKTGDEEDKNAVQQFVDSAKSWVTGDAIKDGIASQFFEFINLMVNLTFEWNKMFTNIMLAFLNFAFETDVVNAWIDLVERLVQGISGIEGSGFSSDGIFGSFIGFIVVITGLVAVFQMTFRRAIISGLSTIVQTVFVLSLALMILTNYGSFMKGINNISTTASQLILTGASNSLTGDHRTPEAVREDMSKNIWDLFIVKPYLIMQYAEEDIDKIGVDRVNKLLKMPKGQDRQDFIEKNEISENNNKMMTYERVPERAVF
ncbi:CD3337/EF1877 family mobilome membrane protein, partial [Bacillus sp. BD48]